MPKGEITFYRFKIHRQEETGDGEEEKIITRYFATSYEASEYLGCSRPTFFKLIKNPDECLLSKHFVAERCRVPKFEKVRVGDFEKW